MKENGKKRIKAERIELDPQNVRSFFNGRAGKKLYHRYNMVNFQDSHPELAIARDKEEKRIVQKYVKFRKDDIVLDIGCGVGRWGDAVVPRLQKGKYIGVDYSDELLKIAEEHFRGSASAMFLSGSFQTLEADLLNAGVRCPADKILVNGVLMYINDGDIAGCLESVDRILKPGGTFYLKEAVGVSERLTLDQFYSADLSSDYSAIYRSIREYTALIRDFFLVKSYSLISSGPSWESDFDEERETYNAYWILRK